MKATSTVVAVVTVVGAAAVLIANAVSGAINWTDMVTLAAAFTGFGLMGAVILRRHSRHRMGWLFVAILGFGLLNGFSGVALEVTNAPLVAALNDITWWPVSVLALVILPLWFPTGTAPTKRWRWVAWLAFVSLAAVITVDLVREDVCVRHANRDNGNGHRR